VSGHEGTWASPGRQVRLAPSEVPSHQNVRRAIIVAPVRQPHTIHPLGRVNGLRSRNDPQPSRLAYPAHPLAEPDRVTRTISDVLYPHLAVAEEQPVELVVGRGQLVVAGANARHI